MLASPLPQPLPLTPAAPPTDPPTPSANAPPQEITGSDDEEEEDQSQYGRGGYYPVQIRELFVGRYQVVRKLGWGHFSTVWLCRDLHRKSFVALKVVRSAATFTETALDEIKLLKCVRDSDPSDHKRDTIVQLTDDFTASGINGDHVCMVMEVLGQHLLKWIIKSNYRGLPLECVRCILRQVLQGLDYLHRKCKIIHTDIKPENILLRVDAVDLQQMAADASLWEEPHPPKPSSQSEPASPSGKTAPSGGFGKKERQSVTQWLGRISGVFQSLGVLTERLSRSQRKRRGRSEAAQERCNAGQCPPGGSVTLLPTLSNTPSTGPTHTHTSRRNTLLVDEEEDEDNTHTMARDGPVCASRPHRTSSSRLDQSRNPSHPPTGSALPSRSCPASTAYAAMLASLRPAHTDHTDPTEHANTEPACQDSLSVTTHKGSVDLLNPEDAHRIRIKIADLGNSCWVHKHFSEDIQTCQYRAIEVLIGAEYDTPADIWSTACMAFELATGEFLFEPYPGKTYSREEDHIAHITELLGPLPVDFALSGRRSRRFFNSKGELRRITRLHPWALCDLLQDKYGWTPSDAQSFSHFLLPMLEPVPAHRATAQQCLQHQWINS
ncbi:SRSF protein kinase 2-like [Alosa sapidissima]|uniref:SRSF protein kinase 2-like n=1 Tax=Alosa sapidissima TaxID=34773 RepID=UPI001C089EC9|nr:SRSF protein kinase 2-like [Alosa sapidissima]XP_041944512.1 SRSF protein kinase 2-like [Alosa sapidissima]XP_041944513.1 SRSF protein kinase 2-like [Alosa sapidissima]